MNIAEPFIRRPVTTTVVTLSIMLFGFMGYRLLPVNDLPNVDFPTIQVNALLPGANPETMASAVATVLERQFSTIAGVDSMTSASGQGATTIILQFSLNRNIDSAAQDVQSAIARAAKDLPPNMPAPPSYQKVNPADQPILYIALTSPTLPLSALDQYGETLMAQRISMVNGVAQVLVFGGQKYAVRIQADPQALASRGIGLDEVAGAIQQGNVNLPTGILYGPHRAFSVMADGQLLNAAAYRPLIVTYRNGAPVRLEEIARVFDSVENNKVAAWFCSSNQQPRSIVLAVQRQPGENTLAVTDAVKALLPLFKKQLPASVEMNILIDRSLPIRASFEDTRFTLMLTLVLVVLVIFLFLRNFSATVIPSLALPVSIVGTFAVMYVLNYSLDNLSLMALTLAIGFVVDDAIVMLENIVRHQEMGKDRWQAALDGSREIGFTIVSMTISLAAVFIPVFFMAGIVGRLFREFAVTIGVAVLASGFVSLTLTPMLCSRFLRAPTSIHHGRIYAFTERGFQAMLQFYERTLRGVLRHQRGTMLWSLVVLVATVALFKIVPKGFLASEDRDQLIGTTEAQEGISYAAMLAKQQQLAAILQQDPDVESFMSSAGVRDGTANRGRFIIRLKPRTERRLNAEAVLQALRPKLNSVPGINTYLQVPPTIQIGARFTKSLYQYTLQGLDTIELYKCAGLLQEAMRKLPGFQDVTTDMQLNNPELRVEIRRDLASSLNVTASQLEDALYNSYASRQVSTIYAPDDQYQVILELLPEYQANPAALALLYVRSGAGKLVPVSAVAGLQEGFGPLFINHSGQLPSVTISFNLQPGFAIGDAVRQIDGLARESIPPGISTTFQGTAQAFQASLQGMGLLLAMAVLVIYMVLAVLYEDFYHPITILSALPFAGFGALVTLLLFKAELSIYAFVGIIMLVGLVKKNGIMMVDFAVEAQHKEGKSPEEAIFSACLIRFRPIMMTTLAALMAGLPIAFGYGAGGEARRPLGLAVVGGLLFSQTLTLYVTPVFFLYMDKLHAAFRRKLHIQARAPVAAA